MQYKYLIKLCQRLCDEVIHINNKQFEKLCTDINRLTDQVQNWNYNDMPEQWYPLYDKYLALNHKKAELLNRESTLAAIYPNMETFWRDADEQVLGLSNKTFWDTYEHGRRRQLEKRLALSYGSESALLVNSGMSAVVSSIEMLNLRENDVVLTTNKNYFETTDYFNSYLQPRGIHVVRIESSEIVTAINKYKPKVVFVETVGNYPETPILSEWKQWLTCYPDVFFIIDNTVQSYLTKWFKDPFFGKENLLIVESATKYITEECVAGVMYGNSQLIEKIRHYTRTVGQHLQEKCFNYLSEGLIDTVYDRLKIHSHNVKVFKRILTSMCFDSIDYIRTLDSNNEGSEIFQEGTGCLIYIKLSSKDNDCKQLHHDVLTLWKRLCRENQLPIRAGFGWNKTTVRLYESGNLNQPDAPNYIRVSVGIEPEAIIKDLAFSLKSIITNLSSPPLTIDSSIFEAAPAI